MSGDFGDERPRWPDRELEPDRDADWRRGIDYRPAVDHDLDPEPEPEPEPEPQPEPEPEPQPEPEPEPAAEPAAEPEPAAELPSPETESAEPTTSLGDAIVDPDGGPDGDAEDWDPRRDGDRRRPTTAEQAVPWLIGLLLALTGIVIVLLALIFVGPEGVAGIPSSSPTISPSVQPSVSEAIGSATPIPTVAPTAVPPLTFGPLEMTFLGRATSSSPIRLSRRDFSTTSDPTVVAEDPAGVGDYAWAPDGRAGAAIIAGRAVAIVDGQQPRTLADPVDALVFADDSSTLYGLRIARDGANDRAEVLSITFDTGATEILATLSYPHPEIVADPALKEAQFADNGGIVRLYVTVDGYVVAWILGAPAAYRVDPATGVFTQIDHQPVLWSPDQRQRVDVTEKSGVSTMTLFDHDAIARASIKVTGLVSHIRWAGSNNEILFTLGRLVGSAVHQDLYVWDLGDGTAPLPLTSNGASFGAEWLGVIQSWLP